jgi:hypothetical protein
MDRIGASDTIVMRDPFPFIVATRTVAEDQKTSLDEDFKHFERTGYLPYECGDDTVPAVRKLVDEITSKEVADALGDKLGIDRLSQYPTLVTIARTFNRRHGTIHTDSKSKVATALVYLNESWNGESGGCLRMLRSADNIDDTIVPEVPPVFGNFVIFKRTDNSFHGHLPFEGERHVIQIAWVVSQAEIDRKEKRGHLSSFLKGIFASLDKKLGASRGRNASHLK